MSDETPFSNGTEGEAWMGVWCNHCAKDHGIHTGDGGGCEIILTAMVPELWRWPEPWVATRDYRKRLPADIDCLAFEPCEPCGGDPLAETREGVRVRIRKTVRAERAAA